MKLIGQLRPSEQEIAALADALDSAERRLDRALQAHCPRHRPIQHHDGFPPWCIDCGHTFRGRKVVNARPPRDPAERSELQDG